MKNALGSLCPCVCAACALEMFDRSLLPNSRMLP
jgi:hypothetical protein